MVLIGLAGLTLGSSCTVYHTAMVTNNPVGSKIGVAKGHTGNIDADFTLKSAMKNGKITKVGIAETKVKMMIFVKGTGVPPQEPATQNSEDDPTPLALPPALGFVSGKR